MTQRAFAGIADIQYGGTAPDLLDVYGPLRYIDWEGGPPNQGVSNALLATALPATSSIREIVNAVVATTIQNQPAGFHLVEHDVIVTSLERG